ncbi:hypothetical protein PanWU01x14_184190 [Parasponia andersonii]|uniref:Protein FAR1-RELATED SEQUENCE n=1 Tax=Parasponia andersonii TaxID=3476 RepID=A0A2P5C4P6_PARAD|nr:hypothetical protein PanWU01x14_184190 [Parasponia andersonii]
MEAAKAYTVTKWEHFMNFLDNEDLGVCHYLASNEVANEKWEQCHFIARKYSIMTSNNSKSFNAVDFKLRKFPIRKLLEFSRGRMQQWFYKRHVATAGMFNILATNVEKQLVDIHAAQL